MADDAAHHRQQEIGEEPDPAHLRVVPGHPLEQPDGAPAETLQGEVQEPLGAALRREPEPEIEQRLQAAQPLDEAGEGGQPAVAEETSELGEDRPRRGERAPERADSRPRGLRLRGRLSCRSLFGSCRSLSLLTRCSLTLRTRGSLTLWTWLTRRTLATLTLWPVSLRTRTTLTLWTWGTIPLWTL